VLWRCFRIPGIAHVVCAIPDTAENDIVAEIARRPQDTQFKWFGIVRGPEHDVLARYAKAAEAVEADIIMRVTADCPLIDPDVCGRILSEFKRYDGKAEFVSNTLLRTWPQGFDCEVFSAALLARANHEATEPYDREHVTAYFPKVVTSIQVEADVDRSHLRWTLDTLEDYVRIWSVFEQQMREAA
jgi:glutamate-1-semialdehyde 2,1-aminomutase/spore coat polysaccharide biosynthesis protein SpsF